MIVISHVVQTLTSENQFISYNDYVLDITNATKSFQKMILIYLSHFGVLGNSLFFVCSAWFLLESSCCRKKKIYSMIVEIWIVSIIITIVTNVFILHHVSIKILIQCLFPTTFSVNWYMTCYMIFYIIHPFLNKIIFEFNKVQMFRSALFMSLLYIVAGFFKSNLFFSSMIILWCAIYFIVAYIKLYMINFVNNNKNNIMGLILCSMCFIGCILLTDIIGLHVSFMSDKMLYWVNNCNPFLIGMAISLFNIFRNCKFTNHTINYLSGMSLLIYIIHENLIIRTY